MTKEERREYAREWRRRNRDRIKEKQLENSRRKALADLQSVDVQSVDMCIIRTWNGGMYRVGRGRR